MDFFPRSQNSRLAIRGKHLRFDRNGQGNRMSGRPCSFDTTFPQDWQAEILEGPPLIATARQYIYPQAVEEVERDALQILLRSRPRAAPVMATFAVGFAEPSLPHGIW